MSIFQPENGENKQEYQSNQKLLCLEGILGAGKTNLINCLKEEMDFYMIPEPVLAWQKNIDSQSLLSNLYEDFHRWGYTFQVNSLLTRAQSIEDEQNLSRGHHLIMERSLLSDRECFARLFFDSGKMSALEWYWYSRHYDFINMNIKHPDAFIYLRVSPENSLKRIQDRERKEERNIPLDYLKDLHRRHEALFGGGFIKNIRGQTPVLVINGDIDFKSNCEQTQETMQIILTFLKENGFE